VGLANESIGFIEKPIGGEPMLLGGRKGRGAGCMRGYASASCRRPSHGLRRVWSSCCQHHNDRVIESPEGGGHVWGGGRDCVRLAHDLGRVYAQGSGSLHTCPGIFTLGIQACDVKPHPIGVAGGYGLEIERQSRQLLGTKMGEAGRELIAGRRRGKWARFPRPRFAFRQAFVCGK